MKALGGALVGVFCLVVAASALQIESGPEIAKARDYRVVRFSSYDRSGTNWDAKGLAAGETRTLVEFTGPGIVSHLWFTFDGGKYHLKTLVLRAYWDGEATPSVEAPIGDFFGLGNAEYVNYQSLFLAVAPLRALNSFFPMPFHKSARITLTNESKEPVSAVFFNIDVRAYATLPANLLHFHAQYRQCAPCVRATEQWLDNPDPRLMNLKHVDAAGNYVILEAEGRGHYLGVTHSITLNQYGWWGEGDEMIFVDGSREVSIHGTGGEDYYLGAWAYDKPFSYSLFGAPMLGDYQPGSRSSVYRFHADAPIPFSKSIRVTMEHGHANHRSDTFSTVAYWYQSEPHARFPALPPAEARLPRANASDATPAR